MAAKNNTPSGLGRRRPFHISQGTAAIHAKVSRYMIAQWEASDFDVSKIPIGALEKLADLYGCTVDDFRAVPANHKK